MKKNNNLSDVIWMIEFSMLTGFIIGFAIVIVFSLN